MLIIRCLLFSLFLTLPALADEVNDTVALTFDWSDVGNSRVEFVAERIQISDGVRSVQSTMTGEGRARLQTHPKGFQITQNQFNVKLDTDMGELTNFLKPMIESVTSMETKTVVSETGELLDIEGLEPAIESLKKSMNVLIDDSPEEVRSMMQNLIPQLVSEEAITKSVYEQWGAVVQQWAGAEFEKGYYYNVEYADRAAAFGGITLGFTGYYEYVGKANCNEQDKLKSCVELSYQSSLSPESAELLTNAVFKQMSVPVPEGFVMSIDSSILLITEAATLKPHYLEKIKTITSPNADQSGTDKKIDQKSYTYFYD